jgi:hypothetical protein
MGANVGKPKIDLKKLEAFLLANPAIFVGMAISCLLLFAGKTPRPAWLKDLPPVGGKVNGAWRGKGSFGKSFGPNRVHHK